MSTWVNVFVQVPADSQSVWIVRLPYFDTPVQAVWSESISAFSWTLSNTTVVDISVNAVFKWRPV